VLELLVLLDERAGLVTVEARHHDVNEHELRLVVGDLGQSVEPVLREDDGATRLQQEDFRAAANRVRVVDYHDLDALQRGLVGHFPSLPPATVARRGLAPALVVFKSATVQAN
jgi:hypothetical protein